MRQGQSHKCRLAAEQATTAQQISRADMANRVPKTGSNC